MNQAAMTDQELIDTLRRWMKPATPAERATAANALPPALKQFALCLGYNSPTRCLEDYRKHTGRTI
jgi:hypothetical protein